MAFGSVAAAHVGQLDLFNGIELIERAGGGQHWRPTLARTVTALRAAFARHVEVTEGAGGLYAGLLEHAPRLARGVADLEAEHRRVLLAFDRAAARLGAADCRTYEVRDSATRLLRELDRHRQHGADLIYEAYALDLGGET